MWSEGRFWLRMEKVWGWKPLERDEGRKKKERVRFWEELLCSLLVKLLEEKDLSNLLMLF